MPILLKLIHTIKRKGTLLNSLYKLIVTGIYKPQIDPTMKGNYRTKPFMFPYEQSQIQEHIKKFIHHDKAYFVPEKQETKD